ncbi:uncharacterized protein [Argopecten irradians]|uniref:uncharacterized protein isoform X2 n=1 Tax=Argopecten irradians TaxID=31199 RepID=UPI003715CCEC
MTTSTRVMGVDLALYRARVGTFTHVTARNVLSNTEYIYKEVSSFWHSLTHDKLDRKGAVSFIDLLLRLQGIEPNPGPRDRDQQPLTSEQTEGSNDVHITMDSNINPVGADRVSQLMETFIPVVTPALTGSSVSGESGGVIAIASQTESSVSGENGGVIAIPGNSSGAVAIPTTVNQLTINYTDNRQYKDEIKVKTMKVEHADNVCTGEQRVVNTDSEKKEGECSSQPKQKTPKRILLEDNADTMLQRHVDDTAGILVTRTEAENAVVKRLKDYNMVMISGVTGEGKTTLGREVCRKLRDGILDDSIKAKTPIIVTTPQDWSDVVNDKDDIVIFVDDMFGKTNYQSGLLNGWKPFFDRILASLREKQVCMVATSRTHILKDARRESGVLTEMVSDHFLSEKKTVNLTDDIKLTREERLSICDNTFCQRKMGVNDWLSSIDRVRLTRSSPPNISIGFPQICKLFFTNDLFFKKGEEFFRHPDKILNEEIEKMRHTEPHKYFALVYCFLKDHSIDTKTLNRVRMTPNDYATLKAYAEVCGVPIKDNVLTVLKNALDALNCTYLTRQNTVFTFSHQSIADSISLVFGKDNPELILERCSDRVIMELLDISEENEHDICTLYVPPDCYQLLVKRMYSMIMKNNIFRITLESFPRFCNEKLADCLFQFITTDGDTMGFVKAHIDTFHEIIIECLLSCCVNNVFFLRAFFKFKLDEFIVKQQGIVTYTRDLLLALELTLTNSLQSMSLLLKKGAFLTESCLRHAIRSNDEKLIKFVISKNIWMDAEVMRNISQNTPDHIREVIKESRSECKVKTIKDLYIKQKTYTNTNVVDLASMSPADMTRAANEMDFDTLHAIFQSPDLEEHRYRLIRIILDSKHKMLADVIALKKILGQIDGKIVQHALYSCDMDMFRFFLFSSNVDQSQLNVMLSEAIHLNKTGHVEVLIKMGGQPSIDDFVHKAGSNYFGVENVVEAIMKSAIWTPAQLNDALDAAVNCGSHATIEILFEGGAQFTETALMSVSKRYGDPQVKSSTIMTPDEQAQLLNQMLKNFHDTAAFQNLDKDVPQPVAYVFSKKKWSDGQINDAVNAAIESGSYATVPFLKEKGGTFRHDALSTAVRRTHETKKVVNYIMRARKWTVDQLSDALHLAMVLCRPDVVLDLRFEGGLYSDSSLVNVLNWNVQHHLQLKFTKYILRGHDWSRECLIEVIHIANERHAYLSLEDMEIEVRESQENEELKELIIETLQSKDEHGESLDKDIRQVNTDDLLCELNIHCDDDCLLDAIDNKPNCRNYDRLRMVQLVLESRSWSAELLMKAMDKSLRLGYTDVVFFLNDRGATFSDQSLEYAIMDKPVGYDTYPLVMYLLERRKFSNEHINTALHMCLEMGHFKLMKMLLKTGAEFADTSLQSAIHKNWKPLDRHPALELVLKTRRWETAEKNAALFNAVKLGDIKVIKSLMGCGGVVSRECLTEVLQRKCKPSHRLSLVRLLVTGSLSQDLLIAVREEAMVLSELKVESYVQQFIV